MALTNQRIDVPVIVDESKCLEKCHACIEGGEQIAQQLSAPLLRQIPLDTRICSGGDTGNPITFQADSLAAQTFKQIAIALSQTLAISPEMRQKEKSSAK